MMAYQDNGNTAARWVVNMWINHPPCAMQIGMLSLSMAAGMATMFCLLVITAGPTILKMQQSLGWKRPSSSPAQIFTTGSSLTMTWLLLLVEQWMQFICSQRLAPSSLASNWFGQKSRSTLHKDAGTAAVLSLNNKCIKVAPNVAAITGHKE